MNSVGLASTEAAERRRRLGPNEIQREKASSRWALLAAQVASPLVWLLIGACVMAGALGELADAFQAAALPAADLSLALALSLIPVSVIELGKLARRLRGRRS